MSMSLFEDRCFEFIDRRGDFLACRDKIDNVRNVALRESAGLLRHECKFAEDPLDHRDFLRRALQRDRIAAGDDAGIEPLFDQMKILVGRTKDGRRFGW